MQVCNLKKNNCEKIYAKQLQFLCRRVLYNHQCHVHEKVYMIWSERSGASVIATALGQDGQYCLYPAYNLLPALIFIQDILLILWPTIELPLNLVTSPTVEMPDSHFMKFTFILASGNQEALNTQQIISSTQWR